MFNELHLSYLKIYALYLVQEVQKLSYSNPCKSLTIMNQHKNTTYSTI